MARNSHWYFAWVDAPGTSGPEFDPAYARDDEIVLGFTVAQQEGEFATLELTIKGRGASLLLASRKQWGWLSEQVGTDVVPHFFGRLVGVQAVRSEDGPVAVLSFTAAPADYDTQKATLADTLRVLPYYDPVFIDPQDRDDDDLVLEGYTKRWHTDRTTHAVTASDELVGEDGLETFLDTDTMYNGFTIELANVPSPVIRVKADCNWTQTGEGTVDLTDYFVTNWPGGITSYTFQASSWPQSGAALGSGWSVRKASCSEQYNLTLKQTTFNNTLTVDWGDWGGGQTVVNASGSDSAMTQTPPGSITFPDINSNQNINITRDNTQLHWTDCPNENEVDPFFSDGVDAITSYSNSLSYEGAIIPKHYLQQTLIAAYKAARDCTEKVSFTLRADIQHVISGPDDNKALDPIDLTSVNLSDPIDDTTGAEIPIGDPRRRSYICTARGKQSLEYLIARAAAALTSSARCVQITFTPKDFDRMADITLRKNAQVTRPEIPGGTAEGKIVGYSYGMARNSGQLDRSVTIACCVGHGGEITEVPGTSVYIDDDYIDDDYYETEGGTELFDSTVGFTPPLFNPNDDGLSLIAGIDAEDAFEQGLSVENTADEQETAIRSGLAQWFDIGGTIPGVPDDEGNTPGQLMIEARQQAITDFLDTIRTVASFKLKSMTGQFDSPYQITVTQLKLPTMIDLEAA